MEEQSTLLEKQVTPAQIMQVGTGFFASKTLLTATKMDLFTLLSSGPLNGEQIRKKLDLHPRSLYDFLDTLVALGFLHRNGLKEGAVYSNSEDTALFLDKNKPSYIGGMLVMLNNRLYRFWDNLEDGLKTGRPQNEVKESSASLFDELYSQPERLKEFMLAMQGVQMGAFIELAKQFDFSGYETLCDIGGASGALSIQVASNNPHMKCTTCDLPAVGPIARENISHFDLDNKIRVADLDFFKDEFPKADIITMGNILHDWGLEEKKMLIRKAFDALPPGGSLVAIENVIDDERRANVFGLIMSLNMMIETTEGFDYTGADFKEWAREAGFSRVEIMPLAGPTSAAVAIK